MNTLTIDYDKLQLLAEAGDRILLSPDGEEILTKLLKLQEQVNEAVKRAKDKLAQKIDEVNPELSSITSGKIKVMYRVYGAKYNLAVTAIDKIDEKYYNKKISYLPNTKEIDKNLREKNTLPSGIGLTARTKTVSISIKADK